VSGVSLLHAFDMDSMGCPPPLLDLRGRLSEFITSYMAYSDFFQTDLRRRRTITQASSAIVLDAITSHSQPGQDRRK
jgi:hypothetical protein